MSFSFGFRGDDIEEDGDDIQTPSIPSTSGAGQSTEVPARVPAKNHRLVDLVGKMIALCITGVLENG
jgi:hypothetical protein